MCVREELSLPPPFCSHISQWQCRVRPDGIGESKGSLLSSQSYTCCFSSIRFPFLCILYKRYVELIFWKMPDEHVAKSKLGLTWGQIQISPL